MRLPIFITNAKNYEASIGNAVLLLTQAHETVAKATGSSLAIAVNPIDLEKVASNAEIPVFAQHVDAIDYGSHTGWIHPASVANAGIPCTLLNHSEHRLPQDQVQAHIEAAFKSGLGVILCAESELEVEKFALMYQSLTLDTYPLPPEFAIAYEPPELIGSSDKSVASENPDIIKKSVALAGDIPLIVGAGVNNPEDIHVALKLGAQGFLVASAICKAENPEAALMALVSAMSA
ncbi:MAG TPA: triose-phosphate isomerase [Candidatus Gracilibacteria bacterium]